MKKSTASPTKQAAAIAAPRVLIAEDMDDQALLLKMILERSGYVVRRVSNGAEAYEAIKAEKPDLLISDVMMAGMSGFELLSRLKAENCLVPSIVLTAKKGEEDILRGLDCGALDYVAKPFSPSELLARVKLVLTRRNK